MVFIRKKEKNGTIYYSLVHSIDNKKQKEKGIGTSIPDNIEDIKAEFFRDIYEEKWFKKLDMIQENFFEDVKNKSKSVLRKSLRNFSIRFTYTSNKIEGNTLNHRDTQMLLEKKIAPNKPIDDINEILAHDRVFDKMLEYDGILDRSIILEWHKDLLINTQPDIAGFFRKGDVTIEGSSVIPPAGIDVYGLLDEFFEWIEYAMNSLIDQSIHPVEFAALVHQKFVTVHPFYDGNGRISRIMQNYILKRYNFPMLIIESKNVKSYYNALERSNNKDDPYIFVQWFIRNYLKANKKFQKILVDQ